MFIGFRLKSDAIYNDLKAQCGPKPCGDERRAASDTGKQDQSIADVGLVVGIVGGAAAVAFLLVRAFAPRGAAAAAAAPITIGLSGLRPSGPVHPAPPPPRPHPPAP